VQAKTVPKAVLPAKPAASVAAVPAKPAAAKPAAKPAPATKPAAGPAVAATPAAAAAAPATAPVGTTAAAAPEPPPRAVTDPTPAAPDAAEIALKEGVKVGSKADTRPARKLFGAAKAPAALSARAIGFYTKGCLAGGRSLAIDGPAWQAMRLSRNRNWGHPKLVALLERFAKEMKEKDNWPGLLIGDISQPRGGPMLTGHKSHQLGLDADIWFRPMPAKPFTKSERETAEPLLLARDNGTEVIAENYNEGFMRLVRRAAKYAEVERVLVHPAIKKKFCDTAGEDREWLRKVRPVFLHNYHFHLRIGCPGDSPTCTAQPPVKAEGDGCGKDLDDWLKIVSRPRKPAPPAPQPTAPVKPSKPAPPMMLKDLPPECTEVIAAADPAPVPAKKKPAAAPTPAAQPAPVAAPAAAAQPAPVAVQR
jgi:penicillin-insensitive murein endopeptidase